MRWKNIEPESGIVAALKHAGKRPEAGNQNKKRHWSERFANGCAVAIADAFRDSELGGKCILPESLAGGTEPLTPLGSGTQKRIDVTVTDTILGLEVGVSLKGLNFRDARSGNFDKNLTGRMYELTDEVRLVHEHLPHAFMVGVFFLPLSSVDDKKSGSASSFARTIVKLRERTGRLDPALAGHASRCDLTYVGLYSNGEPPGITKGACRFQNTKVSPPKTGRPKIEQTLSLDEMIEQIVRQATYTEDIDWADSEEE